MTVQWQTPANAAACLCSGQDVALTSAFTCPADRNRRIASGDPPPKSCSTNKNKARDPGSIPGLVLCRADRI
jgi:hypothetical protein